MYCISYTNGTSIPGLSYKAAIAAVRHKYPLAIIGHDGDLRNGGTRTLCWANADGCYDDEGYDADGANAIATITRSDD
jgi:hypothetical protein